MRLLSTPHGTLGTVSFSFSQARWYITFNSTRYIRNLGKPDLFQFLCYTFNSTRYIRNRSLGWWIGKVHQTFNSTRYIRNTKIPPLKPFKEHLSTPHGTLGTSITTPEIKAAVHLSTPHGTLGTLQRHFAPTGWPYFQLHTVH